MFVPWTKGAKLVGKLHSDEDRLARLTDFRMKYMEEGGMQLWRYFSTKLDAGQECGRVKCVLCVQGDEKKVNCFSRSVVYESVCLLCHPDGSVGGKAESSMVISGRGSYTGESNRSNFDRAG